MPMPNPTPERGVLSVAIDRATLELTQELANISGVPMGAIVQAVLRDFAAQVADALKAQGVKRTRGRRPGVSVASVQERAAELYRGGMKVPAIAAELGYSLSRTYALLQRAGVTRRAGSRRKNATAVTAPKRKIAKRRASD